MNKRKYNCSFVNKLTKEELKRIQRLQRILKKLSKLDKDDLEELIPNDCFIIGDVFCCHVDGIIICIE